MIRFSLIFLLQSVISQETSVSDTETPITFCCGCTLITNDGGCDADDICESVICDEDNVCCTHEWDDVCAALAQSICDIPSIEPSLEPTEYPTPHPTRKRIPKSTPSFEPTFDPTSFPTFLPTSFPVYDTTKEPINTEILDTTDSPTYESTAISTTTSSTNYATEFPSSDPTEFPTYDPISIITDSPTYERSTSSTDYFTDIPSYDPTEFPTERRVLSTIDPISSSTSAPQPRSTLHPTHDPIISITTDLPTYERSTVSVSTSSTDYLTEFPSYEPTEFPIEPVISTLDPISSPTSAPQPRSTLHPTNDPISASTDWSTKVPTRTITNFPTKHPTYVDIMPCCECMHESESSGCDLDDSCDAIICRKDRYCCSKEWDSVCAMTARAVCEDKELPICCGCTESTKHGYKSAGCWYDKECERYICGYDPFCCGYDYHGMGYWDTMCVNKALDVCTNELNSIVYQT